MTTPRPIDTLANLILTDPHAARHAVIYLYGALDHKGDTPDLDDILTKATNSATRHAA